MYKDFIFKQSQFFLLNDSYSTVLKHGHIATMKDNKHWSYQVLWGVFFCHKQNHVKTMENINIRQ